MFDWLWPGKARTASIRTWLVKASAENVAQGIKPPVVKFALPDAKVKLKNPRLNRFHEHEARVIRFLRKQA